MLVFALTAACAPSLSHAAEPAPQPPSPAALAAFVASLKPAAEARGVSPATFDAAFAGIEPDPAVAALTRRQAELNKPTGAYLAAAVTPARVAEGRALLAKYRDDLAGIERRFGVPGAILVAIWGLETDYGAAPGTKDVVRSMATLGAMGYRPDLYRDELLAALDILQRGDVPRDALRGSWAGAMGQPQFMPSSFLKYAVDWHGDGRRDIWTDAPDALASIADFLHEGGWTPGLPWGFELRLPRRFRHRGGGPRALPRLGGAGRGAPRRRRPARREHGHPVLPGRRAGPGLSGHDELLRHQDLQFVGQLRAGGRHAGGPDGGRPGGLGRVADRGADRPRRPRRPPGPARPRWATRSTTARGASA